MPVEQGLPWHLVATGLAGQAIPFVVAASHVHALPFHSGSLFPLFWLPLLPCCAPPPCLLCSPLSFLVWLPRSVCLCCSSPCLLAHLGAPFAHSLLPNPPAPPVRGFHISVRRGLSRARLAGHGPAATPVAGTSQRTGAAPALVECVGTQMRQPRGNPCKGWQVGTVVGEQPCQCALNVCQRKRDMGYTKRERVCV